MVLVVEVIAAVSVSVLMVGEGLRRRKEVHLHTAEVMAAAEMNVVRPDHCYSINNIVVLS